MINIEIFVFNPFHENTYLIYDDTKQCVMIDNGASNQTEAQAINDFINTNKLQPVALLNTHNHIDHLLGNKSFCDKYKIQPQAHKADDFLIDAAIEQGLMFGIKVNTPPQVGKYIDEGELIKFGNSTLKIYHIPGHSPGHVVFYCEADKTLFSGDALFENSIGRTDLPGGNYEQLISNIKSKLLTLPDDVIVYPGHGNSTTIEHERKYNMYLQ